MFIMAKELECRDSDGTGMTLLKYKELLLPKRWIDPATKLEDIETFSYKEGDVFLCSYPKTGSHWLSALVTLVLKDVDLIDVPDTPVERLPLIDMFDTKTLSSRPVPRATSTHLQYKYLPLEHKANKGKIILIIRNPKDVAVSFYYFLQKEYSVQYNGSWKFFLELFRQGKVPYGSYFDFLTSWSRAIEQHPDQNILVVYYEALKENCLKELKRICSYLGRQLDEDHLTGIIKRCSLDNLKTEVERKSFTLGLHDKEGKSTVYRKGQVGDWKTVFTVAESEAFDHVTQQSLKDCSFRFQYG